MLSIAGERRSSDVSDLFQVSILPGGKGIFGELILALFSFNISFLSFERQLSKRHPRIEKF